MQGLDKRMIFARAVPYRRPLLTRRVKIIKALKGYVITGSEKVKTALPRYSIQPQHLQQ